MSWFTAADYNTFLQGKNVGSAEAARVQQWAQGQGYTNNVQSAAGIKNVSSANDIRQMVDAVNAWGAARNQQAAAAAQQAEWQRQAAAQQAEWQRQAAAQQAAAQQAAAQQAAAQQAAAKPPPPAGQPPGGQPPGGSPPGGQPPAEQPNSAGSYNSQLLKMQAELAAQSKAAENPAATAYQKPQNAPVVSSGGDRYQESVRPPAPTFTPAPLAPAAPPSAGPPPAGPPPRPPQGQGPQGQGPTLPPQQQAVPPSQRPKGLAALGVTLGNLYPGSTPVPTPQPQAPQPQAPQPQAPQPQAPQPQAPQPQAPQPQAPQPQAPQAQAAWSEPTTTNARGYRAQRDAQRTAANATDGYGTRDSQARGGTYSGSQAWRNFWNPSASALNSGPLPTPRAYEENEARRWQPSDPSRTATGGAGRRMAGDRFRYTRS